MEAPRNKAINTKKAATQPGGSTDVQEHDFMFPHSPTPVVVRAKDIEEANKKFEAGDYKNNN